jgi:hypothetical protein
MLASAMRRLISEFEPTNQWPPRHPPFVSAQPSHRAFFGSSVDRLSRPCLRSGSGHALDIVIRQPHRVEIGGDPVVLITVSAIAITFANDIFANLS